jgi:hypothetical protein
MESYEKEYFLSKILLGYKIVEYKDLVLHIHPPNIKQNFLAQKIFKETYEEALLSGVFTRKEMLDFMIGQQIWSEDNENLLKKNLKSMEDAKVGVYENFGIVGKREAYREKIREIENDQKRLYTIKHQNDHADCQGLATFARWNWLIENTTTYEDGTPYDFYKLDVGRVLRLSNQEELETSEYREIARFNKWQIIWGNSGSNPERVFNRPATQLTTEQQELVSWTKLYDNIGEATEPPPDEVVNDDDALDGWLISTRRKREKLLKQQKLDGLLDKHQGADEVMLMANTREEVEEVYGLNDGESRMAVKSRMEELENSGGKNIKYHEFRDQRIKILNERNEKFG